MPQITNMSFKKTKNYQRLIRRSWMS